MRLQRLLSTAGLVLGLSAATLVIAGARTPSAAAQPAPRADAETYDIDGGHSSVVFRVEHLGVSMTYGRFNQVSGEFVESDKDRERRVRVVIPTETVDTNSEGRDKHLKGPDFFNAAQFPEIVFESTKVTKKGDDLQVVGDLTLHGVTKSIEVSMEHIGKGDRGARFGFRSGYAGSFRIARSDFDMSFMVDGGMLGDQIEVLLGIEGVRK